MLCQIRSGDIPKPEREREERIIKRKLLHIYHHAHWHEGSMYYKGQIVIKAAEAAPEVEAQ